MSIVGKRIRFKGDICNAPREGIITDLVQTRWGTDAVILWDTDETIGWTADEQGGGEAMVLINPVSKIPATQIGSGRWQIIE